MAPSRKKGDGDGDGRGSGARGKRGRRNSRESTASPSSPTSGLTQAASRTDLEEAAPHMERAPALPFPVVGVGASAGGLEAFTQLLEAMPTDSGMAFVLLSHLSPSHASHLAEILSRATRMPVNEVKNEAKVQPNCVYVIPPDATMVIANGLLKLLPRRPVRGQHHPVDLFFESLARDQGHRSVGVILSGTGSDGTLGLDEIKAVGGIIFAQDQSAAYEGMPRSAILSGAVDFVLAPAEIAAQLTQIAPHPYVASEVPEQPAPAASSHFTKVLNLLHQGTGVDFSHYKMTTLNRRIARRMALHKLDELSDYADLLHKRPAEVEALFQDILINVTSFFRDPDTFELLKTRLFPRMTSEHTTGDAIRMWVVGCSTGEEAYSLGIMFSEFMEREGRVWPVQIFATDLNGTAIERARAGLYPKSIAERVSPERLRRYFYEVDGKYRVAKAIRDMCIFAKHNIAGDPPFSRMDLISCRNLLIYLEPVLQQHLMPILHYALKPTGFLWLGASETTGPFRELFEAEDIRHRFYTKKPALSRVPIPVTLTRAPSERRSPSEPIPGQGRRGEDVQREADRILLARYTPPGVLVTDELEILQFRGDTGAYLAPASGRASLSLMKMLREGLLLPVRGALARAKREGEVVRKEGIRVKANGGWRVVDIEVVPVKMSASSSDCFLVLFHESGQQPEAAPPPRVDEKNEQETARLKQELTATKEYLQSVIEQQEAANEELQSANEEVQSANEELQSINEEIETSKEEIQSSNEELATVNEELQTRNAELGQSNNDLMNLLASVQMAIVMLGPDLRIRRFTPMAEKMLNLIATDVGRPITDIKLNVDVPDLEQVLVEVVETVQPYQREVLDKNGRWHSLRVRPYRTLDNRIDGAVIVLVDIDSIKKTESSLRASEERLRITYDRAPVGIFETDLEGRFVRVNDKFCELTGRDREVLLSLRSQEITHPDDLAADMEGFERIKSGAVPSVRREKRYLRDDGSAVWVELHRFSVADAEGRPAFTVGIAEDITERKETETQLRRREARFRALMNSAPALIWASGVEGMEFVNQAYLEFLGVESHEVLGNAWTYFVHPDDRDAYTAAYERAQSALQPFEHQFRFRRGDGEYRWMMSVALPQIGAAGKFAGYTGATFDITSLKQAEVNLRTADQRKDEFIAVLAHELRNPLAPITNVAQMLKAGGMDEKTEQWAHQVLDRQLRNVGRMVNDLLDVSRISHGKIQLAKERLELGELVGRTLDVFRPAIDAGKKQVLVEMPSKPLVLFADPVRLEQVIGNLVHNAVKFTPQQGHIWLTVTVDENDAQVRISVRDDGDGIATDQLARVFDLFTQGNSSLDRAQGGLGIGLSLVRGLVELHGGSIAAKSDGPGRGSEFIITLPIEEAPLEAETASAEPPDSGPQRILIVDDNIDAAGALAALLLQDGHTVEVAHSGHSGIDLAQTFRPQVALIDLGMPGMNGFEVAERLRAANADVLLVAVSGYSDEQSRRRALAAGFDEYIVKPLDPQALQELLSRRAR
ncbi:MAG TPA: chemotaxis protein CheB [Gemmatimonadales bacterium]|nr:chemotaxis protein CheB [Gemmatimonadales bacterium]